MCSELRSGDAQDIGDIHGADTYLCIDMRKHRSKEMERVGRSS